MNTIALFGGSFDPPHIGHVAIVDALDNFKDIDKVVIMPTFLNPFKSKSYAPSQLRLKWLKEIFKEHKNVEVSDYEINFQKKISTIQTVKYLLKKYKKIYLVIGADNLASLHDWDNYSELKELVTFIVATRDSIKINNSFLRLEIDVDVSSTKLRDYIGNTEISNILLQEIISAYSKHHKG